MKKIFVFSVYPAPYRSVIIDGLKEKYEVDAFFESDGGDGRNSEWFSKNEINSLNTESGRKKFASCKRNIKSYDLAYFIDYTCKEAVKLIFKCRKYKVPYVINCDGEMLIKHGNPIKNLLKKYLIGGAAGYFASGVHAKEYFLRYGAKEEKIFFHRFTSVYKKDILGVPLSVNEKRELRERLSLPTEGKIALAAGRFIPLKRYDVLLELWKEMPQTDYLLLIGGGSEKEKYNEIIKKLDLKNVILEDFRHQDELMNYFRAADIFVHPTSYDVWGLVINEALAAGLPVVVSDTCVSGNELIKDGENGFVVKLYDDEKFINKTKELLHDDNLRKTAAINALKTIAPYCIENMVREQVENIEKILEQNG